MFIPWNAPEKQLLLQFIQTSETAIILHLQLTKTHAFCPSCGTRSNHLHSHYDRFLHDLSTGDQHVSIHLTSRKWFCDESFCPQRIFTERFSWVKPYARQTSRLQQLLRKIAFSMSCRQAEKVACSFLPSISHDTLLRMIRATSITLPATTTIGLDDFSFRKGHRYGTLICDLITHQPLAILPERTTEIVEEWLQRHPYIQVVSRDGSKTYREAISNANPTIQQVSDRWHLLKNAREALEKWLEQQLPSQIELSTAQPKPIDIVSKETPINESKWQLIQQVQQDVAAGLPVTHVAKKHQISRGTVYNYLKQHTPPGKTERKSKPAQLKLQPYYESIIAFEAQQLTLKQILKKIKAEGYQGSTSAVRRFLEPYRAKKKKQFAQTIENLISRRQVTQFIWAGYDALDEEQQKLFAKCLQLYPCLVQAETIVQEYRELFQNKDVNALIDWMKKQLTNKLSPLHHHSIGIRKDIAAVKNALTFSYSNGLLEGQVNRLKWIKRMMYGRAKSDLLEKRMQYQL